MAIAAGSPAASAHLYQASSFVHTPLRLPALLLPLLDLDETENLTSNDTGLAQLLGEPAQGCEHSDLGVFGCGCDVLVPSLHPGEGFGRYWAVVFDNGSEPLPQRLDGGGFDLGRSRE